MPILERRPLENIRARVEEVRARGVIPTARTRVEEIVSRVKERAGVEAGVLTRESGTSTSSVSTGTEGKKKIRGL